MAITYVPHRWTYSAFVSFRGEDIRKSFIDHLFKDFRQKGIHAFRDDTQLPRGEEISSELYKAIEESRFLIVIFSKNYASSSWCLRELVKILDCKQKGEHKHELRIIFYDVKPNVVRKQTESFAEAFIKYEASNKTEVDKWRKALCTASNLSGWDLQDMVNGYESKLIDSISAEILEKLCDGPLHIGENLVGLDARLNNLNLLRVLGSSKVHMIGICGVGGIGKTTLAKTIYNLMYIHFEECSFLEDVQGSTRRHGLTHVVMQLVNDIMKTTDVKISNISKAIMLLKQMIASRSVLLVIDGVEHQEQLEVLAGSRNWFYPGSLIIFTSKDKRLLAHKVDEIYDMEFLDDFEALELFSLYAFRQKQPTKNFIGLSDQVVDYVHGHPLALKVLGCFLYGETIQVWKSELDKLRTYPNADIQRLLRLSFDGLDSVQQRVFLDIASYLLGEDKDFATSVLDSCNFFADTNIKTLVDRSLITISNTMSLQMHNLIQCMAMEIVREESKQVGDRSRLWIQSEVYDALRRNKVSGAVEVLVLLVERSSRNIHIDCNSFTLMNNLRILEVCYLETWRASGLDLQEQSIVNFSGNLEFLSNELRLFYWHGYPFKFLPSTFYPENIVSIDMSYSRIKNLWTTPMYFNRLKRMTLRHCHHLTNLPDFTEIPNLEYLILEGCVNLLEVHPSVGLLKKLNYLSLESCHNLLSFPEKVQMDSLEKFIIWGCSKVEKWPTVIGKIKTLIELCVDLTVINECPSSLSSISNLQTLLIHGRERNHFRWRNLEFQPSSLPSKLHHPQPLVIPSLASLHFVKHLHVSNCNISEVSSDIFEALSCLIELDLGGNSFTSLPASLSQLNQLEYLNLSDCKKLEVLPEIPPSIYSFTACGCTLLHEVWRRLPITSPRGLQMYLFGCRKLVEKHTIESLVSMLLPQGLNYFNVNFDIHIHGSRIPRCFTHQSTGKGVRVVLPSSWCYNKFKGYVACVVFMLKESYNCTDDEVSTLRCSVNNFDGGHLHRKQSCMMTYEFVVNSTQKAGSDMIWLHYSKSKPNWMKAKNFITFSFSCPFLEVKQCGVRLFCDEDIQEEMDSSMTQDLSTPTQDGGVFDPYHEWVSGSIQDESPRIIFR